MAHIILDGSAGSNIVELIPHPTLGHVVRKTPNGGDHPRSVEIAATRACLQHPNIVQYIDHTEAPWSLTVHYIPTDPQQYWSEANVASALATLGDVENLMPHRDDYRHVTRHKGDSAAVEASINDRRLPSRLREHIAYGWWTLIPEWEADGLVPSHADARPENWILSSRGPVLIDFGVAGLAGRGFDKALFLAHLDQAVGWRRFMAEKHDVPWWQVRAVAAMYAGMAGQSFHGDDEWGRQWAEKYLPVFSAVLLLV